MPQGGLLTITRQEVELDAGYSFAGESRPGRYVEFAIVDTGCGMTPAVQACIFEPVFTTKEVGKGTGLGLSPVFGIVRQSEGHIHVWSEFGIGTCFKIYLPAVAPNRETLLPDNNMKIVQQGNETILLVEDDDDVRSIATFSLEAHGYTVLVATNGLKALTLAEQHDGAIHLLVTDIVMPELDGWRIAALLQARRADLKVLFMSGYTDDTIIRSDVIDDQTTFLYKPLTSVGLAKKVHTILDRPG